MGNGRLGVQRMSICRKGYKKPRGFHGYLARDGLYYNGYMGSSDFLEYLKPVWDRAMDKMKQNLSREELIEFEAAIKKKLKE